MDPIKPNSDNRFRNAAALFKHQEFKIFLFVVCFLVFSWPFLTTLTGKAVYFSFAFYAISWIVIIFVLFAGTRSADN